MGWVDKSINAYSKFFGGKDVIKLDQDKNKQYETWKKNMGIKGANEMMAKYAYYYKIKQKNIDILTEQENEIAGEIEALQK